MAARLTLIFTFATWCLQRRRELGLERQQLPHGGERDQTAQAQRRAQSKPQMCLSTRLTRQEKQAGVPSAKEMRLERKAGVSLGRALCAKGRQRGLCNLTCPFIQRLSPFVLDLDLFNSVFYRCIKYQVKNFQRSQFLRICRTRKASSSWQNLLRRAGPGDDRKCAFLRSPHTIKTKSFYSSHLFQIKRVEQFRKEFTKCSLLTSRNLHGLWKNIILGGQP